MSKDSALSAIGRHRVLRAAASLGLAAAVPFAARGADVFNTAAAVPSSAAAPVLEGETAACRETPISAPLELIEAIERSLCKSPKTQAAWANVKMAAAAVGESKSAYLPTLDGSVSYAADHNDTELKKSGLQSNFSQPVNTESLNLSWLLYDFGARASALRGSKELLIASQATQNLALQTVFATTAKDYYTAQAADAAVLAAKRIENAAQQTEDAAAARFAKGVAPITDQLQAKTLHAQAVFQRAKAEGALRIAVGTLAVDMSLPADHPIALPPLDQSKLPDTSFLRAVHDLMEESIENHPTIAAARAQWQAALEEVSNARAEGLPKITLSGSASRSDQPESATIGEPVYPAVTRGQSIGLNIEFPLFEGFATTYKIRQSEAQAEAAAQALRDAQQQIEVGVWSSFETLQTATENLRNTDIVLSSARDTFKAADHRYQSGVGSILELLSAQTVFATAEQQQIQAQYDWRTARILLAQSIGQLGLWAVR